ncbi:hypothetical protein ACU4GD_13755 [Cupriavidus basilensis]
MAQDRHPDASGALRDVAALVLREDPPVQNTRRFLAADARLYGADLKAGDAVLLVLAAASLDERVPAESARPWTLGAGRHACPGDALAVSVAQRGCCRAAGTRRGSRGAVAGISLPALAQYAHSAFPLSAGTARHLAKP